MDSKDVVLKKEGLILPSTATQQQVSEHLSLPKEDSKNPLASIILNGIQLTDVHCVLPEITTLPLLNVLLVDKPSFIFGGKIQRDVTTEFLFQRQAIFRVKLQPRLAPQVNTHNLAPIIALIVPQAITALAMV